MNLIALALALTGSTAELAKPAPFVYRLRNAAAADVAAALTRHAGRHRLPVTVVPEPVSNTVLVAGPVATVGRMTGMLKELDAAPPQVRAEMLILDTPAGFAADVGLADGTEDWDHWVLTPREVRMLDAAIRGAKGRGKVEVLARPQVQVADAQIGSVRVGTDPRGLTVIVKPWVEPEGAIGLRVVTGTTDWFRKPGKQMMGSGSTRSPSWRRAGASSTASRTGVRS